MLDLIGDAHLVLIGEATYGTDESYSIRAADEGTHPIEAALV
jgi:erythromycin esterase-like protein